MKVFVFTLSMIVFYLLIAFITSNPYLLTWHWGVKLVYVLLGLYTINKLSKGTNI
jgi:hypothetical protein